jgi:hypothetical protein
MAVVRVLTRLAKKVAAIPPKGGVLTSSLTGCTTLRWWLHWVALGKKYGL